MTDQPGLSSLPVAVIGAGPVGLAAAARLVERGLQPIVLEQGTRVALGNAAMGPCTRVLAVGVQRRRCCSHPA
ncbi:MAG: NAD(P)-binding protein [Gammaproteobacteria bacterium]|nr:NAD(P)-binding protein [Gammaproteobacteria bacterium]